MLGAGAGSGMPEPYFERNSSAWPTLFATSVAYAPEG